MFARGTGIKIFTGNANPAFCVEVARNLNLPVGDAEVTKFSDGETRVVIKESVRGSDVFIVQPTCAPANDHLMELLILIDAMRRASAGRITAVMPYFGYARQDRKMLPRDPITAKLVADLIAAAGADRVLTMDLHAAQIQGFFSIPVDHLRGAPVLSNHYLNRRFEGEDLVIVSPDLGGVARARDMAARLNAPLAIIDKRRNHPSQAEVLNLIGEVAGRRALIVDDMIDTAGTVTAVARLLEERGVTAMYACCTHGVFSGPALERIEVSPIREMVCTNTVPVASSRKVRAITVAERFSRAIECIYEDWPVSPLYD